MVVTTVDSSGCYALPAFRVLSMPDTKESAPVKRSVWHRPRLPKWLLREGRRPAFPSRSKRRQWGSYHHHDGDCRTSISFPQIPLTDSAAGVSHSSVSNTQVSDHKGQPTTLSSNRRAVSADRPSSQQYDRKTHAEEVFESRLSAPEIQWDSSEATDLAKRFGSDSLRFASDRYDSGTNTGNISPDGEDFKDALENELDKIWILNLSLRFRNGSDREKFFVTYVETPTLWRRVTVSCDYDRAEPGSLEQDLNQQSTQSEKNVRIYESLRESISEIKFFDTVTNLRLETVDGQLHVNVAEDANEIISYPTISAAPPLSSCFVVESQLTFGAHFSGFAYQVEYDGVDYVKKEMPGPDSVDEFLYEINALYELLGSKNVIQLKAIVVDDTCQVMKGLLLDFALKGDLVGLLEDCERGISWKRRGRWAKQIVEGLAEIHEAGFVQGDLTLTNVVVDDQDNAKIIDINRRGCPIGWEPPEFKRKLDNKQRISMYIGVKSDLFQLGMILWALAMEIDQPERHPQPLVIPRDTQIPDYYRKMVQTCLSHRPQDRLSAKELLELFPQEQIFPASAAHYAAEGDVLVSATHIPYQNEAVCPTQVLDHLDQCTDPPQAAGTPNDPVKTHCMTSKPTPSHCHDGPCTHSRCSLASNRDPNCVAVASLPIDSDNSEEHLVELADLPMGIDSTAVQDTVTNAVCNSSSQNPGSIAGEPEFELEAPAHMFSVADPRPPASGLACLSEKVPFPEDLTFIGSHPFCLLDGRSMAEARDHTQPDSLRAPNSSHYAVGQAAYSGASDIAAPGTPRDIQGSDTALASVTSQADLLSSCLPINPAFMPWTHEELQHDSTRSHYNSIQFPDDGFGKCADRELHRETSIANVDDLFTSHLPINPNHDEQRETTWETLPGNLVSSFGCESQSEVHIPAILSRCDAILQSEYSASVTDSLLASGLPINPAAITDCRLEAGTMSSGNEDCSMVPPHLSGPNTLLTRLPINPAVTLG